MSYGKVTRAKLAALLRRLADRLKSEENHDTINENTDYPWWSKHPAVERQNRSPETKHKAKEQRNWRYQNILGFVTLVVAIIVARYAYKTYIQAERQADAAWQSVQDGREQAVDQLRAYFSAEPKFHNKLLPDGRLLSVTIEVNWENNGLTPAKNTLVNNGSGYRITPAPTSGVIQGFARDNGVIADTGSRETAGSNIIDINDVDLRKIGQEKEFLYIWGEVTYRDVMRNTPIRHSKYFWRVVVSVDSPDRPVNLVAYGTENSSD